MDATIDPVSLWRRACESAGLLDGHDVELVVADRGSFGWGDAIESRATGEGADGPRHRVTVRAELSEREMLETMRRLLECARQHDCNPRAVLVGSVLRRELAARFEPLGPGADVFIDSIPTEAGAALAARTLLEHADPSLATPLEPVDGESLCRELLAFAALFPDELTRGAQNHGLHAAELLESLCEGYAGLWDRLLEDPFIAAVRAAMRVARPTPAAIRAAGERPENAWMPLLERLEEGRELALEQIDAA